MELAEFALSPQVLRLRFPILVIKYAYEVNDRVGVTELIITLKPKIVEG